MWPSGPVSIFDPRSELLNALNAFYLLRTASPTGFPGIELTDALAEMVTRNQVSMPPASSSKRVVPVLLQVWNGP